jgi:hypothetical protein
MTDNFITSDYCKTKCNNVILPKNNVNSLYFSNTSRRVRQSALLSSRSPLITSGVIIYGNTMSNEEGVKYTPPNEYYNNIVNNTIQDTSSKQHYLKQSLELMRKMKR